MGTCGELMQKIAVVAFVFLIIAGLCSTVVGVFTLGDAWEEVQEDYEEHEEDCSEKDCSTCDRYEREERTVKAQTFQLFLAAVEGIAWYSVCCGLLYVTGEIAIRFADYQSNKKREYQTAAAAYATPVAPQPRPAVVFCTNCGKKRVSDERFCGECGTPYEN